MAAFKYHGVTFTVRTRTGLDLLDQDNGGQGRVNRKLLMALGHDLNTIEAIPDNTLQRVNTFTDWAQITTIKGDHPLAALSWDVPDAVLKSLYDAWIDALQDAVLYRKWKAAIDEANKEVTDPNE